MVILHISHKQEPENVVKIIKSFLQKDISVTLEPTNARATRNILKEIELQGLKQVVIQSKKIHISP